jgi:hypothetical protein
MEEFTGKGKLKQGIHDYKHGETFTLNDMIFNCHNCNTTFSPVRATLQVSNHARYFNGVWARMCWIKEIEEDKVCNCDPTRTIMMYDNIDPVLNSIHKKEVGKCID